MFLIFILFALSVPGFFCKFHGGFYFHFLLLFAQRVTCCKCSQYTPSQLVCSLPYIMLDSYSHLLVIQLPGDDISICSNCSIFQYYLSKLHGAFHIYFLSLITQSIICQKYCQLTLIYLILNLSLVVILLCMCRTFFTFFDFLSSLRYIISQSNFLVLSCFYRKLYNIIVCYFQLYYVINLLNFISDQFLGFNSYDANQFHIMLVLPHLVFFCPNSS